MKTTLLMVLCCVTLAHAQHADVVLAQHAFPTKILSQDKLLTASDFKKMEGRMVVTEIPCKISRGTCADQIKVSLVCQQNAYNELGLEKINEIIVLANQKAHATTGADQNFTPTEIRMSYNPLIKDWSLTHAFSTHDKDGKACAKMLTMDFDASGKFLVMKRVF